MSPPVPRRALANMAIAILGVLDLGVLPQVIDFATQSIGGIF